MIEFAFFLFRYVEEAQQLLVAFNKELFISIELGLPTEDTKEAFQKAFYYGLHTGDSSFIEECKKKASALYVVTYSRAIHDPYHDTTSNGFPPRLSFPWHICC